jgi:hypothetical protein
LDGRDARGVLGQHADDANACKRAHARRAQDARHACGHRAEWNRARESDADKPLARNADGHDHANHAHADHPDSYHPHYPGHAAQPDDDAREPQA